ncbi:MAG: two-component system response regulator [Mariprofundaceae bacterium]
MNEAKQAKILIVDDEEKNRKLLQAFLEADGYLALEAADGAKGLEMIAEHNPDLVLLDVMMPVMNGYQVAQAIKTDPETQPIPIIMVTALEDRESRIKGLDAGAEEFLSKPVDRLDLSVRVRNLLRLKELGDFLKYHNQILEQQVQKRTEQLKKSFFDSIFTLMRAADYRDDETGAHVKRISYFTKLIAEELGMSADFCDTIFYASPMHDVGKIGIPDKVLLKPGALDADEWDTMKKHTTIGGKILSNGSSLYMRMGRDIALAHHERWDGSGYPKGLAGEEIPLAARIMQISDVYDALGSKRPYKPAFEHDRCLEIIIKGDGRVMPEHFDPEVLNAFKARTESMKEIRFDVNEATKTGTWSAGSLQI